MTSAKDKIEKFEERRKYPRITINVPVTLELPGNRNVEATVYDVSPGGVQIHCERVVAGILKAETKGSNTDFDAGFMLKIDHKQTEIKARCRLVWIVKMDNEDYAIGVKFTAVDAHNRQLLKKFIESSMEPQ